MKQERRWVAWMAALMLAVALLATPREGAAASRPYIFIDLPGGPLFGDPDVPGDSSVQPRTDGLWLRVKGFWLWVRAVPTSIVVVGSAKRDTPLPAKRTAR